MRKAQTLRALAARLRTTAAARQTSGAGGWSAASWMRRPRRARRERRRASSSSRSAKSQGSRGSGRASCACPSCAARCRPASPTRFRRPSPRREASTGAGRRRERVRGRAEGGGLAQHHAAVPDDEVGGGQQADAVDRPVGHDDAGQAGRQQASSLVLVARDHDERHVAPAGQPAEQVDERRLVGRRRLAGRQAHRRRGRPHHAGDVLRRSTPSRASASGSGCASWR